MKRGSKQCTVEATVDCQSRRRESMEREPRSLGDFRFPKGFRRSRSIRDHLSPRRDNSNLGRAQMRIPRDLDRNSTLVLILIVSSVLLARPLAIPSLSPSLSLSL